MSRWTEKKIKVPAYLDEEDRGAYALDAIDMIVKRTSKGLDKNGKRFPSYSKDYSGSLDFKIAGKSKNKIDLQLSGDMLADMELLKSNKGEIVIGYDDGNPSEGKAEGNIRGSYGKPIGSRKSARDFLGLTDEEVSLLNKKYPKSEDKRKKNVEKTKELFGDAEEISGRVILDELEDE